MNYHVTDQPPAEMVRTRGKYGEIVDELANLEAGEAIVVELAEDAVDARDAIDQFIAAVRRRAQEMGRTVYRGIREHMEPGSFSVYETVTGDLCVRRNP